MTQDSARDSITMKSHPGEYLFTLRGGLSDLINRHLYNKSVCIFSLAIARVAIWPYTLVLFTVTFCHNLFFGLTEQIKSFSSN